MSLPGFTSFGAAFTSLESHNGCRALFNHTKGWAYIGPAGPIDSADFPGTVSYEYKKGTSSSATRGVAPPPPPPSRPGDGLSRKTNNVRRAYLDAADLEHLVHEAERLSCPSSGVPAGEGLEEGGGDGDAEEEGRQDAPRRGRPIVLTLQAILAATSPASAGAGSAATTVVSAATGEGEGGVRESGDKTLMSPRVSDRADFPPLRGTQTTTGLLLAPPITMVKRQKNRQPSAGAAAVDEVDGGYEDDDADGGVSCSEAVAATSVAEAAQQMGVGRGVSRVGWWLRWGESDAPAAAVSVAAAAPTAAAVEAGRCSPSSTMDSSSVVGGIDGGVSYETRPGVDGWQVVSGATDTSAAASGCISSGGRMQPTPTRAYPTGGAWSLVLAESGAGTAAGNPSGGVVVDDDDAASSWCDCASDVDEVEVEGEVVEMLQVRRGVESLTVGGGEGRDGEADRDVSPAALVDVSHDAMYNGGGYDGGDGGVFAVPVAFALQCVANKSVWDRDEDAANLEHPDQPYTSQHQHQQEKEQEQHLLSENVVIATMTTNVPQNVPRSFRDMLMTPTATGETGFSRSKAFGCGNKTSRSSGPTLVNGANGGAVYLWRKAAAGEGGKAWDRDAGREDEDPYYARKRVGAFAFKTKPRGKAHK